MTTHDIPPCPEPSAPRRIHYHYGMLLTESEMRAEQDYHLGKGRMHNRYLHGHGTVCGLAVEPTHPASELVVVQPGYAIDCCGRDVVVTEPIAVDVRSLFEEPTKGRVYVTLAYDEAGVAPVPVPGDDPTSPGEGHTPSRTEERAIVGADTERPADLPGVAVIAGVPPCPPCEDARITLAALELPEAGPITRADIDNGVRRVVGAAPETASPFRELTRIERRIDRVEKGALGVGALAVAGWLISRTRRR